MFVRRRSRIHEMLALVVVRLLVRRAAAATTNKQVNQSRVVQRRRGQVREEGLEYGSLKLLFVGAVRRRQLQLRLTCRGRGHRIGRCKLARAKQLLLVARRGDELRLRSRNRLAEQVRRCKLSALELLLLLLVLDWSSCAVRTARGALVELLRDERRRLLKLRRLDVNNLVVVIVFVLIAIIISCAAQESSLDRVQTSRVAQVEHLQLLLALQLRVRVEPLPQVVAGGCGQVVGCTERLVGELGRSA